MRNKGLLIVTLILTVIATAARVLLLPVTAGAGLTTVNYPLLLILVAATAVPLVMGRAKKGQAFSALSDKVGVVATAGMLFGLLMISNTVNDAYNWLVDGVAPAPSTAILNGVDGLALKVSLLAGAVGGVFLIAQFFGRRQYEDMRLSRVAVLVTGAVGALSGVSVIVLSVMNWRETTAVALTDKLRQQALMTLLQGVVVGVLLAVVFVRWLLRGERKTGWLWLLPVLWLFARVVRYDVVYATSVDIAPAVYEFLTFGVALLFLLAAAQYFAGVGKPSRWLRGMAAATAVLTISASLSRLLLWVMGQVAAVAYCPLPTAADAALGLFALMMATQFCAAAPAEEENA